MTDPSPLVATDRLLAFRTPADPDDAYENRIHIPDADRHLAAWPKDAATFRRSFAGANLNLPMVAPNGPAMICSHPRAA